jgi:putative ABC transport system permease protein
VRTANLQPSTANRQPSTVNQKKMLKNYIKIAWRNLFRNKGFSLTNILGLSIGMTCTILILLWVQDELSYNKFHSNYPNIYQVIANRDFKNQMFTDHSMVLPLASSLEAAYPQIKYAVATTYNDDHILTVGNSKLTKSGLTVSDHFFNMFSWKVLKGDPVAAMKDPTSVVLTEATAKALFGNEDPMNKIVRIDNANNLKVMAVLADLPDNSSMKFDFIYPFDYSDAQTKKSMTEWVNSSWQVYVQPQPGTNLGQLTKDINKLKSQHDPNDKISSYFIFPMNRWRLYNEFKDGKNTGGMIVYVRLFSIIALIILLIACVNFMNLSTARSEKRAKEVGIRKTLGSEKWQLISQFFMESMILAFISFFISIIAVFLLLPEFNLLVDKKLTLPVGHPVFWAASALVVLFTGLVAGSYPALYLSSFNPVKTLKGTFLVGKKAAIPRHILVVGQFIISILLISATIIVYRQIEFVKSRDIGYKPDNLLMVASSPDIDKNFTALKNDLLGTGMIQAVNRAGTSITRTQWRSGPPDWDGKPADASIIFSCLSTDIDYVKTMGIHLLEGKDFSGTPIDSSSVILNQAAVDAMHVKNPMGMELRYDVKKYKVIGITSNVVMDSPFDPVAPTLIFCNTDYSVVVNVRLKDGVPPQKAITSMQGIFNKYNPAFPFDYGFVDKEFGKKFTTETLISKITNIFAGLAIFICCIGLAGLASFTIEKRIREIGIRKVLGATIRQVLMLISTQFLKLAGIAFLIAVPLTWWLMNHWLDNYTYRISISIWLFMAVGFLILLLTLVVVSLNTIRAAMSNPVDSLRSE